MCSLRLAAGGATLSVCFLARAQGVDAAERQTMAVTMLAMGQVAYLFNCRNLRGTSLRWSLLFRNRVVWLSVAALFGLQALFVYAPIMHTLFSSSPLPANAWGITLGIAAAIFLIVEGGKALIHRHAR